MGVTRPVIIDILVVIDGETVYNTVGPGGDSIDTAKQFSQTDAYMICAKKYLVSGEATNYLTFQARRGDTVRWRGCSLSKGLWFKVDMKALSKYDPQSTATVLDGIHTVEFGEWNQVLEADVVAKGTEAYDLYIQLFDADGNSVGWYYWDPYIVVK